MKQSLYPRVLSTLVCICALMPIVSASPAWAYSDEWQIRKTQWTVADEQNYGRFVAAIGAAVESRACGTVDKCMKSVANPYRQMDPPGMRFQADCADFPYFMRAYFAWKNSLPFSISSGMKPSPDERNRGADIRYTPFGNMVTSRINFISGYSGNNNNDVYQIFSTVIAHMTSTANFRVGFANNDKGRNFSDFYPVKIDRNSIAPGTNMYDANGHVGIVYKVTNDGQVWYVDAHPDNSLTIGKFSVKVPRSNPHVGAGFKRWRPLVLVNASQGWNGTYEDGEIVGVPNSKLPDYSYEQFFGTNGTPDSDWKAAKFTFNGKNVSFHEYVRLKLAANDLKLDPINEMRATVADICRSLRDRVDSVNAALKNGIDRKEHPSSLPANIYGSEGDWENYSTPGRDVSVKILYKYLLAQSTDLVERWKNRDPAIVYSGSNLAADLLATYQAESRACTFTYQNSAGANVTLDLEKVRARVYLMSFDPYHCVERRWGATGAELSTCREDSYKRQWYERTQQLRNHSERKTEVRTDLDFDEWKRLVPGVGVQTPADVDIEALLRRL